MGSLTATGVRVPLTAPLPAGYKVISSDTMMNATYERLTQRATIGTLAAGRKRSSRSACNQIGLVSRHLKATVQANEPEEAMRNNQSVVMVTTLIYTPPVIPRWLFSAANTTRP